MANGDPVLVGNRTLGSAMTIVESRPLSAPGSGGPFGTSSITDQPLQLPVNAVLVGWNNNTSGGGILGRAAPGGIGVFGTSSFAETTPVPGDFGVFGTAISTGVSGFASGDVTGSGTGVAGMGKVGVHGHALNFGSASFGVVGESEAGTGVAGSSPSSGNGVTGSSNSGIGVIARSESGLGVSASSGTNIGLVAATQTGAAAAVFEGKVIIAGDLFVTGNKHAAVPQAGGAHTLLYCLESPESWLEDFGEARLVNGRAQIRIDRGFAQTIDTRSYHVFISAYGAEHVFVSKRSRNGFEIRAVPREGAEMPKSLRCSYRIVARRRSVKASRLKRIQLPQIPDLLPKAETPQFPRLPKIVARAKPRGRRKSAR
jgi:hypothetical protein